MDLLTAMDTMHTTLTAADAPARQLAGVTVWRGTIQAAATAGSVFSRPAGMTIAAPTRRARRGRFHPHPVRFLYGHATHAAWRDLCVTILAALEEQQDHARQIAALWRTRRAAATSRTEYVHATRRINAAVAWWSAANHATVFGRDLVALEDSIQVPVGRAIKAAGVAEVAVDKHYHQQGVTR